MSCEVNTEINQKYSAKEIIQSVKDEIVPHESTAQETGVI